MAEQIQAIELTAEERAILGFGLGKITGEGYIELEQSLAIQKKLGADSLPEHFDRERPDA